MRIKGRIPTELILIIACAALAGMIGGDAGADWEQMPPIPVNGARGGAVSVNNGGTLFLLGGYPYINRGEQSPVHYLLTGESQWRSDIPIDNPVQQMGGGIDSFGRIVLFAGHEIGGDWRRDTYVYQPGKGATDGLADLPRWLIGFASTMDDQGRIYCIAGLSVQNRGTTEVFRYDAKVDLWETLAPMPVDGRYAGTAVYDGRGHIIYFGGYNKWTTRRESSAFSYDIATDTWMQIADQPANRSDQGGVRGADGKVYAIGGYGNANPNQWVRKRDVYVFDPDSGVWTTGPSLYETHVYPACVLRDDGFIYAIGGSETNAVERLDTNSGPVVADLVELTMLEGQIISGGLPEMCTSDDTYVHTRSGFGVTVVDLHNMEMIVNAVTTVDAATSIDLTFESRIDEPAGLAQIRLRNWNTNQFESVGSYSLSNTDQIDKIVGVDATNYVYTSGGNIDLSIKHLVFVPFLAFTFESFVDLVEILVQ